VVVVPDAVVILKTLRLGVVRVPPTEALPVIAKGALIVTSLVPVPDISSDGVFGSVSRFALRRIG
jgi:hypothetical protein